MNAHAAAEDRRVTEVVRGWAARDAVRAMVPADHAAIESTEGARALVAEHALRAVAGPGDPELYDACAQLGWVLGREGASPTLAASVIDGLADALDGGAPPWVPAARAALLEAYVAARLDVAGENARRAWEYPACAVVLDEGRVAITAGYPADDGERLAEWAARVARAAVRAGVRRARLSGGEAQIAALAAALDLAGVGVEPSPVGPPREGRGRVRTWLPWRRT